MEGQYLDDEAGLPAPAPDEIAERRPYTSPVLRKYGRIEEVTKGVGVTGTDEGLTSV